MGADRAWEQREPAILLKTEYKALLQVAGENPRDFAIVMLFLQTGLRVSELVSLKLQARSTAHLLAALEEFKHLGIRFISVQDQIDTHSPMGRAMFTIIGAMAELESSLIGERVTAGMRAAKARGRRLGRPPVAPRLVANIEHLARTTELSVRGIHQAVGRQVSRGIVGQITKRVRESQPRAGR